MGTSTNLPACRTKAKKVEVTHALLAIDCMIMINVTANSEPLTCAVPERLCASFLGACQRIGCKFVYTKYFVQRGGCHKI